MDLKTFLTNCCCVQYYDKFKELKIDFDSLLKIKPKYLEKIIVDDEFSLGCLLEEIESYHNSSNLNSITDHNYVSDNRNVSNDSQIQFNNSIDNNDILNPTSPLKQLNNLNNLTPSTSKENDLNNRTTSSTKNKKSKVNADHYNLHLSQFLDIKLNSSDTTTTTIEKIGNRVHYLMGENGLDNLRSNRGQLQTVVGFVIGRNSTEHDLQIIKSKEEDKTGLNYICDAILTKKRNAVDYAKRKRKKKKDLEEEFRKKQQKEKERVIDHNLEN